MPDQLRHDGRLLIEFAAVWCVRHVRYHPVDSTLVVPLAWDTHVDPLAVVDPNSELGRVRQSVHGATKLSECLQPLLGNVRPFVRYFNIQADAVVVALLDCSDDRIDKVAPQGGILCDFDCSRRPSDERMHR
eukprot:NODE_1948_length_1347_cov_15.291217_g1765_i0.p1 GENE.NODE_1948_length_1347_cov_15.291217_g1765_i0~~NODE_1948_length_1347_cov_15.291217_g1765_i0.p1  ORF type:complete len:132 (-),score=12.21 NODE_1948_length_1347_cov_15.291217_g1765_i0:813-1208(-)